MAYTLEYNSKINTIEVAFVGSVSGPEVREATTNAITLLKKHGGSKVLIDTTRLEVAPQFFDIYNLPAYQYVEEGLSHKTRLALITPESTKVSEATQFYETACVNRGWLVRSFSARDEALEWLKGIDTSD